MIVKMKKVSIVNSAERKVETLKKLRALGVLHVETAPADMEKLGTLLERYESARQALQFLPPDAIPQKVEGHSAAPEEVIREIYALVEEKNALTEENSRLMAEGETLKPWGHFLGSDLKELASLGVTINLYELNKEKLAALDEEVEFVVLEQGKQSSKIAVVGSTEKVTGADPFPVPERSLLEIEAKINHNDFRIKDIELELTGMVSHKKNLEDHILVLEKELEFKSVANEMEEESVLVVLTGYIPADNVPAVKEAAAAEGWGTVIRDPSDEDPVPTLTKNPGWIKIINPVFNLLGTTPGYKEYDISFWFLLFFGLFFAMIIGDAGYGAVMLIGTLLGWAKAKKDPSRVFTLLTVMSLATIGWGTLTGTWFGSQGILETFPFLKVPVIPSLASFAEVFSRTSQENTLFVMSFCFLLGAIHLSLARIMNFIKLMPSLLAFAELGWLVLIWGLYFLVGNIVMGQVMPWFAKYLILVGIGLVILCGKQNGKFFKGLGIGLASSPLTGLNAISAFSDIISYVRLFAVGLATVEVAKAFNAMAAESGLVVGIIILILGHTINLVMGAMSIIVHGVRLNMLEFSGHLGMEWAGRKYKPFKD